MSKWQIAEARAAELIGLQSIYGVSHCKERRSGQYTLDRILRLLSPREFPSTIATRVLKLI